MSDQDDVDAEDIQTIFGDDGPDPDKMTNSYIPESEEWSGKTRLHPGDPSNAAALVVLPDFYPELPWLEPVLEKWAEEFYRSRTSVGRQSARDEIGAILRSMYGGRVGENKGTNVVMNALAPEDDD